MCRNEGDSFVASSSPFFLGFFTACIKTVPLTAQGTAAIRMSTPIAHIRQQMTLPYIVGFALLVIDSVWQKALQLVPELETRFAS